MINRFPFEVLVKIFKDVERGDIRQCLLVNKLWSRAARMFVKKAIHVTLTDERSLYQDLLQFPHLASRVTKLTINSNDTLYCILTLNLCPNILHLAFHKCSPHRLLDRLTESEYTLLPKVQEISAGPGDYTLTNIILPCKWKHRATITKLTTYESSPFLQKHTKDLPEFISHFPQLEVLVARGVSDMNVHRLLSLGRNLRTISLCKASLYYDDMDDPEASLSTKLKEFSNIGPMHINVLKFLTRISSNNFKKFEITSGSVIVEENQDKGVLLKDIFKGGFSYLKPEIEHTDSAYNWPRDILWERS